MYENLNIKKAIHYELEPHYVRLYNKTRKSYRKKSTYLGRCKSSSGINTVALRFALNKTFMKSL